jgi:hypothetical protein
MSIPCPAGRRAFENAKRRHRRTIMLYHGSCHCGSVAFEIEGQLDAAVACNCTICSRKGALLWAVPRDRLHLLTPQDDLRTYSFHQHLFQHRFCQVCGIHPYAEAGGDEPTAFVNIRCLEGIDPTDVTVLEFDGRSA